MRRHCRTIDSTVFTMRFAPIVIALTFSCAASGQSWNSPGYAPSAIENLFSQTLRVPLDDGNSVNGGLVVGRANAAMNAPAEAFLRVPTGNGDAMLVPKGVYHYSEKEEEVKGELVLPDLDDPIGWVKQMLKGNTDAKSTDRTTNGLYIPLPFGMEPINIQLSTDETNGEGLDGEVGARNVKEPLVSNNFFARTLLDSLHSTHDMMRQQRGAKALQLAREICLYYDRTACEAALQRYFNIRDGRVPDIDVRRSDHDARNRDPTEEAKDLANRLTHNLMDIMVPVVDESINTLSLRPDRRTSPIAALSGGREQKLNQRGLGLLVGMPGIDPMYFGGFVNNEKDKPLNLGLAPGSN